MGGSAGVNVRQLLRMLDMDAKCLDDGRTDGRRGRASKSGRNLFSVQFVTQLSREN
jgi:hypothetical protein